MLHALDNEVHSKFPPCDCSTCLRSTAIAHQRRAEIEAFLSRLDDAERLSKEAE